MRKHGHKLTCCSSAARSTIALMQLTELGELQGCNAVGGDQRIQRTGRQWLLEKLQKSCKSNTTCLLCGVALEKA